MKIFEENIYICTEHAWYFLLFPKQYNYLYNIYLFVKSNLEMI
jgi:hypothetical protein